MGGINLASPLLAGKLHPQLLQVLRSRKLRFHLLDWSCNDTLRTLLDVLKNLPIVSKLLEFSWMESIALVRVASLAVSPPLLETLLLSLFSSLAETQEL